MKVTQPKPTLKPLESDEQPPPTSDQPIEDEQVPRPAEATPTTGKPKSEPAAASSEPEGSGDAAPPESETIPWWAITDVLDAVSSGSGRPAGSHDVGPGDLRSTLDSIADILDRAAAPVQTIPTPAFPEYSASPQQQLAPMPTPAPAAAGMPIGGKLLLAGAIAGLGVLMLTRRSHPETID